MKKITLLIMFLTLSNNFWGQELFNQDFNSSTVLSSYINAALPSNGQFNAITTAGSSTASIVGNALQFERIDATTSFTRSAGFSATPNAMVYKFNLTVNGTPAATADQAARWQIGSGYNAATNGIEPSNTYAQMAIDFRGSSSFRFNDVTNSTTSATFNVGTSYAVTWVMNNSGSTITYIAPNGSSETVANDKVDFWVGTTRVYNDINVQSPAGTIENMKFAFTASTGIISVDNLLVRGMVTPQNTDFSGATICNESTGFLTLAMSAGAGPFTVVYNNGGPNRTVSGVMSGVPFTTVVNPTLTTDYTLVSIMDASGAIRTSGFGDNMATVTVNPLTVEESLIVTECDQYSWAANGTTYTTSGTYVHVTGCNTATLILTILPSTSNNSSTAEGCGSYTWPVNGNTYVVSGIYTYVVGCNTATLDLTIDPFTTNGSQTITACGTNYKWPLNGQVYTSSGTYTHTVGCNVATLTLTLLPATSGTSTTATACGSYTWAADGNTYIVSGIYTHVVNCNVSTLNVTILPLLTPGVFLSSSDEDNTFISGTTVDFTAVASNYSTGTLMYNFKVGGVSVQMGPSNVYSTSSLTNLQTVTVDAIITGGTCLASSVVSSNAIVNTVIGIELIQFLYTAKYCGITSGSISPTFYCTTPAVGASTLVYRFRITNTATNQVAIVNRTVPNADLLQANAVSPGIAAYSTLYTAQVAAVVDGVLQPYSSVCTVTTPALPLNQVVSTQCGSTLAALNSVINVTTIVGTVNYRFKVSLASSPSVFEEVLSPFPNFRLTSLTTIPLDYGNTYSIQVQSDVVNNTFAATTPYGPVCNVTTAAATTIISAPNACGTTLTDLNARIYVNAIPGAVQYTYRVALASAPMTYYTVSSPFTSFRLTSVPGLPLTFNTTYEIAVSVTVNTNGSNVDTGYGTAVCQYTTPIFPTTQLQTTQCGGSSFYEVPDNTTSLVANFVSGAAYRFKIENVPSGMSFSQTITRPVSNFTLSMFTGLMTGTEYRVSVALDLNGSGPFGPVCTIKTPGVPPMVTRVIDTPFSAIAYPNPFASGFTVGVTTKSASNVSIKVYDMLGRLVEARDSKVAELETTTVGEQYPSGVYNVIVTQESSVSSVRMIKR